MTFNPNSDIGGGRASRRGRTTGIAVGGGLGVVALFLISQFLGFDVTGLVGGGGTDPAASDSALEQCQTGQDANERVDCRMQGASASLEDYWQQTGPDLGIQYAGPQDFILFSQAVATGCGNASSATGPFYCPPDQTIYVDTSFFDQLESQFGATGGPLSEMYIVAHEWGHHVQNIAGVLSQSQDGQTGPTSNAVRVEDRGPERRAVPPADHARGVRPGDRRRGGRRRRPDPGGDAAAGHAPLLHARHERAAGAVVRDRLRAGSRRLQHLRGRRQPALMRTLAATLVAIVGVLVIVVVAFLVWANLVFQGERAPSLAAWRS